MQASAHPGLALEYTGTITHAPEARTRLLDGVASVPVLVLDLALDCPTRNPMQVQVPYPVGAHDQAAMDSKRWHVGDRVTVHTSLLDLRLIAPNAISLRAANLPTPSPTPDLFGA